MQRYIQAELIKADLVEIDEQLNDRKPNSMEGILLIKQIFLTVANLVDFELTIRPLYKEHRNLSSDYRSISKECEFAKYLRNKFVGHINQKLIEKAIEWKPELRYFLKKINNKNIIFVYNLFILETATNSYVNPDGTHKIFCSESDFSYPPDLDRFSEYLTVTVKSSIEFLSKVSQVLGSEVEMLDPSEQKMEHWEAAGNSKFEFIRR